MNRSDDGGVTFQGVGTEIFYEDGPFEYIDSTVEYSSEYCYLIVDNEQGPGPPHEWGPVRTDPAPSGLPIPPAPVDEPMFAITKIADGAVHLQVIDGVDDSDTYGVLTRHPNCGQEECLWIWTDAWDTKCGTTVIASDNGEVVEIKVRAENSGGNGPYSTQIESAIPMPPPNTTQVLCVDNHVEVWWDDLSWADDYIVSYQKMDPPGNPIEFSTGGSGQNWALITDLDPNSSYCFAVRAIDSSGNSTDLGNAMCCVTGSTAAGVDVSKGKSELEWLSVRGNPTAAGGTVRIAFNVHSEQPVEVNVYDAGGRCVRRLYRRTRGPGIERVVWDTNDDGGKTLASGVYFVGIQRGNGRKAAKKLVLLR